MTDISRYKNISLSKETYIRLKKQSKMIVDVDLSISKTVELASNLLQDIIDDPAWVRPLKGSSAYQAYKKKLLTQTYGQVKSLSPYEKMRQVSKENNANTN
tara:strand:+ start:84 stop:386 length:303 start_codon:yes stop_codon:yes gene_type:complete